MATRTERRRRAQLVLVPLLLLVNCVGSPSGETLERSTASWSVTAWGDRFEAFPEVGVLVAGQTSTAQTHVTRLSDFRPVVDARVEMVLVGPAGEQVFGTAQPDRPGIFAIAVTPAEAGEADVLLRIHDAEGTEEIRCGRLRIGAEEGQGSLLRAPAPRGSSDGGESLSFSKEEQWRSAFETAWVREGRLAGSVSGLATVRPPAGGEITVTSPVDGVVRPPRRPARWPFPGLSVDRGETIFQVAPLISPGRSLATLEAEVAALTLEMEAARQRLERLHELLTLDASSEHEVEEARVRAETLAARHEAAAQDLEAAHVSREGGSGGRSLQLKAPFSGEVASVYATHGSIVSAGDALARLVRTDLVWIEVAVPPGGARRLATHGVRGLVLDDLESAPVRLEDGVSLVSVAPELSPRTGTVTVLLEVQRPVELALGSTIAAQVLSTEERLGVVVPATALIDDGGVSVVYLQLSGESFVRQEVTVLERQGDRVLVGRLVPGQRLVTRGGDAIRRSSLMSSGGAHGHVH